jgi:hypothetical protein
MSKVTVTCLDWRPLAKGSLLGFAKIRIDELGLILREVTVHRSHGSFWASPPARPQLHNDSVLRDDRGKIAYAALIEFERKAIRDAFSARVVEAVRAYAPGALADRESVP